MTTNMELPKETKLYEISPYIAREKKIPSSFPAKALKQTAKAAYLYGKAGDTTIDSWFPKAFIKGWWDTEVQISIPEEHPMVTTPKKKATLVKTTTGKPLIKITFPFSYEELDRVKSLPGRTYHKQGRFWTAPLSLEAVEKLEEWDYHIDAAIMRWKEGVVGNVEEIESVQLNLPEGLYEFQKKGVQFLHNKNGRGLIADEMGLGKTVQALGYLYAHPEQRPAVVVCPAAVKYNWEREAKRWLPNTHPHVLNGKKAYPLPKADLYIINYDILADHLDPLGKVKPQVLIVDECFPAGTKISTPNGDKNIEEIKEGDVVYNAIGKGVVKRVGKRTTEILVKLYLSNNRTITTTPNHLFFTTEGWVPAKNLDKKYLLTSSDVFNIMDNNIVLKTKEARDEKNKEKMSSMPYLIQNECLEPEILQSPLHSKVPPQPKEIPQEMRMVPSGLFGRYTQTKVLQHILLSEMENVPTRICGKNNKSIHPRTTFQKPQNAAPTQSAMGTTSIRKNEKEQPSKRPQSDTENQRNMETMWTPSFPTAAKRRKWSASTKGTENTMGSIRHRLEAGVPNQNEAKQRLWISNLLQSRHSTAGEKSLDRSGWMEPRLARNKKEGRKERILSSHIRVERVEIQKSTDRNESPKRTVYNLEVSGHPSYYAEGVLVHNCHLIKNNKAKRTKAVKALGKAVPHFIALSGTPIVNRPVEFFNALHLIEPGLFPSFWKYAHRYCGATYTGYGWDFNGATNTEELHERLVNTIMLRRKKADVLKDLPPKQRAILPLEITNEEEYRAAEQDFIAWLSEAKGNEAAQKAANAEALVKIETLKQISVKGKLKAATQWIQDFLDVDGKLVVFCTHKATIDYLMTRFKDIAVKVDGSTKDRQAAVDKFQNDPHCRLFVGNLKAAGVGITLTAASNVAFLELGWTPGDHDQAEDRVHRIGQQATSITAWYLIGLGTIEETIARIIDKKRKVLDEVLDGKTTEQESLLTELINSYKERS